MGEQQAQHDEWDGQNRRATPHGSKPRFDPTVNLGHILTFVGFMAAIFTGWTTLDKRVTIIEERTNYQAQIDRNQDANLAASMLLIKESLGEIKMQIVRMGERYDRRGNVP